MTLSELQAQGRADYELERDSFLTYDKQSGSRWLDDEKILAFLDSYALTVWNAALDSALEVLPKEEFICGQWPSDNCDSDCSFQEVRIARNFYRREARIAITSLKQIS